MYHHERCDGSGYPFGLAGRLYPSGRPRLRPGGRLGRAAHGSQPAARWPFA
ncbi:MAG: hypothetical protein JNK29_08535 [Anaerolineales bacterium]|nr:hypothetical protein [Anaerolineales bacterium]